MKAFIQLFTIALVLINMSAGNAKALYTSQCGPESRALRKARLQLEPWFSEFESKLKASPQYDRLASEVLKDINDGDNVVCFFYVKARRVTHLRVNQPHFETLVSDLLEQVQPLRKPPNDLLSESSHGVRLTFERKGQAVEITAHLGPLLKRIGEK